MKNADDECFYKNSILIDKSFTVAVNVLKDKKVNE